MKKIFSSLCARLALSFVGVFFILGVAFFLLTNWSNNQYYQELTQNLNKSLAMYIVQRAPLIKNGLVNESAMKELSDLVMIVNPIVEVYLLDTEGNILAHSLPKETIVHKKVSMTPIHALLAKTQPFPITGDDPRSAEGRRVFSAFPVTENANTLGYLYVVLGGQTYQTLTQSLRGSYIVKESLVGLAALILFASISALFIFAVLTRPLRQLANDMNRFQTSELKSPNIQEYQGDEISYLSTTFNAMRKRIHEQLEKLQETDRLRRELISNVSHDLRTPLSSMQGYIEMLLKPGITADERNNYSAIAYKHCNRLTQLVKELFELSKLDAGRTSPQWEFFSLAELLQDVAQKYSLDAKQKNISLTTPSSQSLFMVNADIALIEHVLENLIDNALRYTPENGTIRLTLKQKTDGVEVGVSDTGVGVDAKDLPYIFERYYRANKASPHHTESTGLGLAIVQRILELHGSMIQVESAPSQGTSFMFTLTSNMLDKTG